MWRLFFFEALIELVFRVAFQTMAPQELLMYLSIPVVSAVVGWGTNVLALKMTFYPVEFIGIRPIFGWQGIIPSKALKMANMTVDMLTTRLVGVEEIFARLDADRVVEELQPGVSELLNQIINHVLLEQRPQLWATLPDYVKQEIYDKASADAAVVIRESLDDIQVNIEDILDIKKMSVDALMADKRFLVEIFLECGREEFKFIERSGIWFGFLFGLIQMMVWFFYKGQWLLPAAGFVVGYLTNILALRLIFSPRQPTQVGPFKLQGMFLRRQMEVSEAYARMITDQIVNMDNLMQSIFHGPMTDRLLDIVQKHVQQSVESYAGLAEPIIRLVVGSKDYEHIKSLISENIVESVPSGPVMDIREYAEEAMDIERTLRTRLQELPPEQFEGLLRPVFQEDEWKLILVGAVLGLAAGFAQLFFW